METTINTGENKGLGALLRLQIGLAFFTFILMGMNDGAIGVILPSIRAYYGVDKATVSFLFLAATSGYLCAAFMSGLLIEKLGHRRPLLVATLSFLAGALTISLTPSFLVLLPGLAAIGFGIGIFDAGLNAYIAVLPRNTAVLNNLHAFYGVGALLGPLVASTILAIGWGWNIVYVIWLGVGLILLVAFSLIFGGQHAHEEAHREASAKTEGNVLFNTLKLRVVWLAAFFLVFYVGTEVSLGNWSYSFLTEERHEPLLLSGWAVSGYWLGLTVGRFTLGKVAERIGNKRLIQLCLAGVVVGVLIVWLVPVGVISALGLWLVGFSLGPIFPTTIALLPGFIPARLVPSAIGFVASLASLGAAFFPWLAGNLAEGLGLWSLLPYVISLTAVMLFIWLALQSRSKPVKAY